MRSAARTEWQATYFDGRTAGRHAVSVTLSAVAIRIGHADGRTTTWPYGEVHQVQGSRVGEPVRLERGGDAAEVLILDDPDILSAIREAAPHYRDRFTDRSRHRARTRWVIAAIAAAVAAVAAAYVWGIPLLAGHVATLVPVEWEESLGRSVVEAAVDSSDVCAMPEALTGLVDRLAAAQSSPYRFRVMVLDDTVVNAFAAPGGYLVVNRGLLELAEAPEELAGVLAHEMQHVMLRHGTRAMLREIPLQLIVVAVTGDAGMARQVVGAAATLGSLRYGRRAEQEADREGMRLLQAARVDPRGMVTFFGRMRERVGDVPRAAAYLSTHPRTEARIRRLEDLAAGAAATPVPVMDRPAWESVKRACASLEPS